MTAKNFIIKNGLTVGTTEVIDSSGDLTAAAFNTAAKEAIDDQVNSLLTAGTGISLSYDDAAGTLTVSGQQGDITGIVAGAGLTGDASSGEATLNVVGGTGIIANTNDIAIDPSVVTTLTGSQTLTNKTLTAPILNGALSGTGFLDEDNFASDSNVAVASQQSIKAYVATQIATKDNTDEMTEGSTNLYHTSERVDDRVNALLQEGTGISLTYDDASGTLTVANTNSADITGVTAGDGLSGGGTSGALSLAVDLNELTAASVDIANDSVAIIDASDNSSKKESFADIATAMAGTGITATNGVLSTTVGDITSVVAGSGLTGGGTSGDATLNVIGGDGITANADDIALSSSVAGDGLTYSSGVLAVQVDDSSIETDSDTLQVKALGVTNAMLAGSIAEGKLAGSIGNAKLSNSSITIDGTAVSLGGSITTTNTQLTQEQVEDFVGGMLDGTETGISVSYDDTDGNIDFVVADSDFALTGDVTGTVTQTAKGNVSIATTIAANSVALGTDTTGNYIAAVSAGTGISVSGSGEGATSTVSIGQAVGTSDNVAFANLVLSGDLTVNGSTVTNSSTNTTIEDQLIELGTGNSGSASGDAGFVIERGSDANVFIGWDESADAVTFGTGTFTGASSGNLTITPSAVNTGALTITNASNSGGTARNIYQSTSAPGGSDGAVGDLWILYS